MEVLTVDPDPRVRSTVAMKRSCPPALLKKLSADRVEMVRERVAYNAKTPHEILRALADDMNPRIAAIAKRRLP